MNNEKKLPNEYLHEVIQEENEDDENEDSLIEDAAKNHLIDFCIAFKQNYRANWHHEIIANELQKIESGEFQKEGKQILMIFAPPRHGKSEETSIDFPAWFLGRRPEKEIIVSSYSSELAQEFGSRTRDIVGNPNYQNIFDVTLKEDQQAKGRWKTDKGGSYTSVGIGGSITGFGADLFIIDDPIKNTEEAESEVFRNRVWNWFKTVAYTRLQPGGVMVIILTRWNFDDLAARILNEPEYSKKTKVISFPAIAEQDDEFRKEGEALWPERYNKEYLLSIKAVDLMQFSALYQQTPLMAEAQEFKQQYFRYFEFEEIKDKLETINIFIDPAISKQKNACDTGIIDLGKIKDKADWFILEDSSRKMDPGEISDIVFEKVIYYRKQFEGVIVNICVETIAYQEALAYWFKKEMALRQIYFNIKEIKTRTDKEQRIRGLIPFYKNGVIKHAQHLKGGKLETQLIMFPKGKIIDAVDALSFNTVFEKGVRKLSFGALDSVYNDNTNPITGISAPIITPMPNLASQRNLDARERRMANGMTIRRSETAAA